MGGYGAYALAMTYPEQYSAAAGLSGAYMPLRFGRDTEPFWQDIFGTMSDYTGSENDLVATSSRLVREGGPLPRLYMWCGTEDGLYSQNLAMRDHLNAIGWEDFTFEESAGNHNWKCWDEKIQTVLAWIHAGR